MSKKQVDTFDIMYEDILFHWPKLIEINENSARPDLTPKELSFIYEENIEPIFEYGDDYSDLHRHLLWALYQVVDVCAKVCNRIVLSDIRRDSVKFRFHSTLYKAAIPQLKGEKEFDNSYDLDEVKEYFKIMNLEY